MPALTLHEEQTVLELFQQVVTDRSSAPAIVHERREMSFQQLDELACQFARSLKAEGVGAGDRVGLCIEKCPEAIAAMLGVFKVGAAFVPLDPEYPIDRIEFMISDADIRVLITHDRATNPLANGIDERLEMRWIDSCSIDFAELESTFDSIVAAPDDLAYIMYTSGSTGKPKGVQIQHAALVAYCLADIEVYELNSRDRTLQFSTLNFDIAIEEIFPPLLIGSCVVVRPSERADVANELSSIIEKYDVTAVHLATAYWHEWVDLMVATGNNAPASLRLVIATGEKVSVAHYRRWISLCDHEVLWCNAYGPTEATVSATVFKPAADFDEPSMPIGQALPGYEAYILDSENCPVEDDATGELLIGGPALALGYLNRPDLTQKAFVDIDLPDVGQKRLYRTGDLARWLPNDHIEFAGRIDHQIKLGSYRIEPGEIEAAFNRHPAVLESLVTHEEVEGQKFLLAFIATGKNEVTVEQLVEFGQSSLPAYMVPPRYVLLEAFPKTINGKIDRDALPDASKSVTASEGSYVAPRNDLEKQLCELWQAVLHLPQVGIYDDFFALGGSSLLVTRIVASLTEELDIELPVRDFFANPTVASSARHLQHLLGHEEAENQDAIAAATTESRQRLPTLAAEFISSGQRRLFAVRYQPRCNDVRWCNRRRKGVVMCHAVGHEYSRAYRNLQQLAVQLAADGFDVLRFDYYGTGNSSGESTDFRVESMQADIRSAIAHLKSEAGVDSISLVGIRIGATLAANVSRDQEIDKLVLWDPVPEAQAFLLNLEKLHQESLNSQQRFARRIVDSEAGQLFGYPWSEEQRASFMQLRMPAVYDGRNLVLTSESYADCPPDLLKPAKGWNQIETKDAIHWDDPKYTESAFASPQAYRLIRDYLGQEESL